MVRTMAYVPGLHTLGELLPARDLAAARTAVLTALPGDPSHETARARIAAFMDEHPDALQRSCAVGHLTGSALVVDREERRILLLLHAKMRRWLQPGGHADGDANLARVSLREAIEESGIDDLRVVTPAIDLDVHVFHHAAGAEPDHLHLDVRHLVLAPSRARGQHNHESDGSAWVTIDQLPRFDPEPGLLRLAHSGLGLLDRLDPGTVLESPAV
jgi:ADP-ribose pyrophosphatase YjhB (NUDIX family)